MHVRHLLLVLGLVVFAHPLRAQDVECDPREKEVRTLDFQGNETFNGNELETRVLTTASSTVRRVPILRGFFGTKRCLPPDGLKPDIASLKEFYRLNGFYEAQVDTAVRAYSDSSIGVIFRIREGPPMLVDSLTIRGLETIDQRTREQNILRGMQLQVGERFGMVALAADVDTIVARLRNAGYPHVDVGRNFSTNAETHRARVTLDVIPGALAHFGQDSIAAAPAEGYSRRQIPDSTVRTLMGFHEGDRYSDRAITTAQRNLYQTGDYRHVGIAIDTTYPHGDSVVNVNVDLIEDLMQQLDSELGWATLDCFRANLQYTNRNYLARTWRLEATARASKIGYASPTNGLKNLCYRRNLDRDPLASSKLNYYLGTALRIPAGFAGRAAPTYTVYTERRGEFQAYLRSTYVGLDLSVASDISPTTPFRIGYTIEYGNTIAQPAVLCGIFRRCTADEQNEVTRTQSFAVLSTTYQRARTDNPVDPRSGTVFRSELRGSAPYIGSDQTLEFLKGTVDGSWYRPAGHGMVLAGRLRLGAIGGGAATRGIRLPPPQERLYAGGAGSVRGFDQNLLGAVIYLVDSVVVTPVNDSVRFYTVAPGVNPQFRIPVGGNRLVVANAELRIPDVIFPPGIVQYVLFTDAGQVWVQQQSTFGRTRIEVTPGFAVKYFSPVGPLQVNVGYKPLTNRSGRAYYTAPLDPTGFAPVYCVSPSATPIPVRRVGTQWVQDDASACLSSYAPAQSNAFFKRFLLTLSITTDF